MLCNYGTIKNGIENFYRIINEPYTEDKYYTVSVDLEYDDGFYYPTSSIYIPVYKHKTVYETTIFGNKREIVKGYEDKEKITVYAVKTEKGIYEIFTNRLISVHGGPGTQNCLGIYEIGNYAIEEIASTLKKIQNHQSDYCSKLYEASTKAYNIVDNFYKELEEKQKSKEEAIQYVKSFRR